MKQNSRTYQIIIEGRLDNEWEEWLDPLKITSFEDGTSQLSGKLSDQAALMGLLNKLYRLNLELVSIKRLE